MLIPLNFKSAARLEFLRFFDISTLLSLEKVKFRGFKVASMIWKKNFFFGVSTPYPNDKFQWLPF